MSKTQKHDQVVAETPKAAETTTKTTEPKIKTTPVNERKYKLVSTPSIPPKGKQRQIVLNALSTDKDRGFTVEEVADFATKAGLQAVGGVIPSCRYHLHHLVKLGFVEILNPKIEVSEKTETKAA